MPKQPSQSGNLVLLAASCVCVVLGSIHAFSVFLAPLEAQFDASRSAVSLTYSMGLVALTIAVLLGPRIFPIMSAARFMAMACGLAALGASVAALAGSLPMVWLGYSLIFGAANGLGYGYGLQIAAQVNPGREGLAMGVVTAAYALGAVGAPALFDKAVHAQGFALAMWELAAILLITGTLAAALMHKAKARFHAAPADTAQPNAPRNTQTLLWLGYFGGVLAGLMVIGHAAGIAASFRPGLAPWIAPVVIAACNLLGSLISGRLADHMRWHRLLIALALLTSVALAGLASFGDTALLMLGFGIIGFAYGGTIAAFPAAIAKLFGMQASAHVYGRIFTAWGSAGLIGPWLAGYLFDVSGGYGTALFVAAAIGLGSVVAITLAARLGQPHWISSGPTPSA